MAAYTTIDDPSAHFTTTLWTGGGTLSPRSITNDANSGDFQPDLVWTKGRATAYEHQIYDSSRGAGATKGLCANTSNAEGHFGQYGYLSSFDSNGFTSTSGSSGQNAYYNVSGQTYVAWQWKANGGTTSSNTDGSITSTVQANTTAGFSIVTWTGSGSAGTIGHGLGAVPTHFMVKERNGADDWQNYSPFLTGLNYVFSLNNTYNQFTPASYINSTAPTSSVFSVDSSIINQSGQTYVGYFFTDIQGYSKMGKYTGNGNANGSFIYTGFKPAFIMLKNLSQNASWHMFDAKRVGYNPNNNPLYANLTNAETTYDEIDIYSNGFKIITTDGEINGNGNGVVYLSFAENPFVTSTGIPTTAR